jgi:hypothetical protein
MENFEGAWPALPYGEFAPTAYLMHRLVQVMGKLKLSLPFEMHWAEVALVITSRGLTTELIPYRGGGYSVDVDLITHQVTCASTSGRSAGFALAPRSVAAQTKLLLDALRDIGVEVTINMKPQEVPSPVLFHLDTGARPYEAALANAWWRILVSCDRVMRQHHARFAGKTPPVGLMFGTFDIRDVRYNGVSVPAEGPNAGYIRRNAMDEGQIESGWWHGSDNYAKPAFYSFTFPQPPGIERSKVLPAPARWDAAMGEFLLDYDDLRQSSDPDAELLSFLESTYQAGASLAGWDPKWIASGQPK